MKFSKLCCYYYVDACFFDFIKAFDKVGHAKPIHKLKEIGVNSQKTNWI